MGCISRKQKQRLVFMPSIAHLSVLMLLALIASSQTSCMTRAPAKRGIIGVQSIQDGMGAVIPLFNKQANLSIIDQGYEGYKITLQKVLRGKGLSYHDLFMELDVLYRYYCIYREYDSERGLDIQEAFLRLLKSSDIEHVRCTLTYVYYHPRLANVAIDEKIRQLVSVQDEYVRRFAQEWNKRPEIPKDRSRPVPPGWRTQ